MHFIVPQDQGYNCSIQLEAAEANLQVRDSVAVTLDVRRPPCD